MTDPNETANLVGQITGAYREHAAEEAAKRPQTYDEASDGNIVDQIDRYRELADHEMTARAIITLQARGEWTEERARIAAHAMKTHRRPAQCGISGLHRACGQCRTVEENEGKPGDDEDRGEARRPSDGPARAQGKYGRDRHCQRDNANASEALRHLIAENGDRDADKTRNGEEHGW